MLKNDRWINEQAAAGMIEAYAERYDLTGPLEDPIASCLAAALLREARPRWVPVAERPWERPNWCDSEGRCWWLTMDQSWPCIYLMKPNSTLATDSATYALQHWAILIPSPTENINGSTNR